jgi:FtsP/CotA-like multicopper oxidase with cupredoxin domain
MLMAIPFACSSRPVKASVVNWLPPLPFKDVVMLGGYQEAEVDFVADNPGLTLFHCHQQLHMDYGFMALFDYRKPA